MRRAAMSAIATMIAAILGRSVGAAVSRGVRLPRQKLELLRRLGLLDVVRT
jgi:hypothetical protein